MAFIKSLNCPHYPQATYYMLATISNKDIFPAKRAGLTAKYITNTYDLGDGEIDFPACHRVLRSIRFKGWLCADLDITRNGPRTSYERCGTYVVKTLEPIYA